MASTTIFDGSEPPSFVHVGGSRHHHEDTHPSSNHPNNPSNTPSHPLPGGASPKPVFLDYEPLHYRLMTKAEWLQFCRGVGVLKDDESEEVIRTTSRLWPPSAFRDGLFSDGE